MSGLKTTKNKKKSIPGGLFTVSVDEDLTIVRANEYFYQLFGYTREDAEKDGIDNLRQIIPLENQEHLRRNIIKVIQEKRDEFDLEFQGLSKNKGLLWYLVRGSYNEDTNEIKGILLDITKRKRRQESDKNAELNRTKEQLKKEYYRDSLTGLLNRKGIMESFASLLEGQKDNLHGFLMIDLDDFKAYNDYSGHLFGDQVLEKVAKELQSIFRSEDIVGRLGGDEFVVIFTDIPEAAILEKKAQLIKDTFECKLENGKTLSLSQGLALYPKDGTTFMELYKKADIALYEAKAKGKNQYFVYSEDPKAESFIDTQGINSCAVDEEETIERNEVAEELRKMQEIYRWGLEKARVAFWEYSLDDKTFINSFGQAYESIDGMVKAGKIHKDSASEVALLKEEVIAGKEEGEIFIKGSGPDEVFEWLKISYRTMGKNCKEPWRIFAVAEVLPGELRSKIRYLREEWVKREVQAMGLMAYVTNLSKNRVDPFKLQCLKSNILRETKEIDTYEDVLNNIADSFVKQGQGEEFKEKFSANVLIENFNQGTDFIKDMVQMIDQDGRLRWVTIYTHIIIHPVNGDYYAYTYIKDDDERGKRENALVQPLVRESITELYDGISLSKAVSRILDQKDDNKNYGMIVLDMVNYSSQQSQQGDKIFLKTFARIADDFRLFMPSKYICAIKGKGELVFFIEEGQNTSIREKSEEILEKLRGLFHLVDPKGVFLFYGGVASLTKGENFQTLYEKAIMARNIAATGENWNYAFYDDKEQWGQRPILELEETAGHAKSELVLGNMDDYSLKDDEDLVQSCLLCASNLIEKQELEAALFKSCVVLADYYFAEAVFIAEVESHDYRQTRSLLWQKGGDSFLHDQDLPEDFILASTFFKPYKRKESFITNNIMAVPFIIDDLFFGFVGVAKPIRRKEDKRLLSLISHIMGTELYRLRLRESNDYYSIHDIKTGFYNRLQYIKVLEKLQTEGLSSLGVLLIEINEVEEKKTLQGMESFEKKVERIAEVIQQAFIEGEIYRAEDGKFIVLCRDVALKRFMSLGTKIQEALFLNIPGEAFLGYCWSGDDVDVNRLLQHAEELKEIDRFKYREGITNNKREDSDKEADKLLEDIKNNRFAVSIQPIINASTGKTRGGEVLVRKIDDEGYLHLPVEFIDKYEALGIIRYIDLFVLEESCKILSTWIDKGITTIPLSVNFSRETLLETDIISKLVTISNKYGIPRGLIEIEVTERLGAVEESTIIEIARAIKASGFGVSLDDFGTEYSNLSVVSNLKLDIIKIDRSLISQIHENKTTEVIIRSVLQLCKELEIKSVAEGVETLTQIDALKEWGCDYLQGFYYSKAVPAEDFKDIYLNYSDL